jgi:hypothetical protein
LEVSGRLRAQAALCPGTHCVGGCVDPRAGLFPLEMPFVFVCTQTDVRLPSAQAVGLIVFMFDI